MNSPTKRGFGDFALNNIFLLQLWTLLWTTFVLKVSNLSDHFCPPAGKKEERDSHWVSQPDPSPHPEWWRSSCSRSQCLHSPELAQFSCNSSPHHTRRALAGNVLLKVLIVTGTRPSTQLFNGLIYILWYWICWPQIKINKLVHSK